MAELSGRSSQSACAQTKPLIYVGNKPMYRHAIDCLPLQLASSLIFVVCKNEFSQYLINDIKANYGPIAPCYIVELNEPTLGQAESVLFCAPFLNLNSPTLVHNYDIYLKTDFDWKKLSERSIDGALIVIHSEQERLTRVKLDEHELKIIDVQENTKISNYVSSGTSYFKNSITLLEDIELIIKNNWKEDTEFYLSTVYKVMISSGKHIIPLWAKKLLCFSTPADLATTANDLHFLEALAESESVIF